jgi:hypothetical protein
VALGLSTTGQCLSLVLVVAREFFVATKAAWVLVACFLVYGLVIRVNGLVLYSHNIVAARSGAGAEIFFAVYRVVAFATGNSGVGAVIEDDFPFAAFVHLDAVGRNFWLRGDSRQNKGRRHTEDGQYEQSFHKPDSSLKSDQNRVS